MITEPVIYALVEPKTLAVRYVGRTKNLRARMRLHWQSRRWPAERRSPLSRWMAKLTRRPGVVVLEAFADEVGDCEFFAAEWYWIAVFNRAGMALLNRYMMAKDRARIAKVAP